MAFVLLIIYINTSTINEYKSQCYNLKSIKRHLKISVKYSSLDSASEFLSIFHLFYRAHKKY